MALLIHSMNFFQFLFFFYFDFSMKMTTYEYTEIHSNGLCASHRLVQNATWVDRWRKHWTMCSANSPSIPPHMWRKVIVISNKENTAGNTMTSCGYSKWYLSIQIIFFNQKYVPIGEVSNKFSDDWWKLDPFLRILSSVSGILVIL